MRPDVFRIILRWYALFAAVADALFIIFCAVLFGLILSGKLLLAPYFGGVCLAAAIINGVFLCLAALYLCFRKK